MKAAVLHEIGAPLKLQDVPVPQIGPDEVLVRTKTCGICRTDLHIQDGLAYVPSLPHVPGHEPAGVVEAIGRDVTEFKVGDRVVPHLFLTCGQCYYCRTGEQAQCSNLGGVIGVTTWGGFAEFFKAPARNLLKLPDEVSFESGGLTSCATITAAHAFRRAGLSMGQSAMVLGAGGIGQILIQLLRSAGIRTVAAGRAPASLEAARKNGAACAVSLENPKVNELILEFGGGEGVDCVFECVGLAETMNLAAKCLRRGGQIIVIGEEPEFPKIDTIQIAQRELRIIGSRNGSLQDAADALEFLRAGVISPLIAARFPLDGLNDALRMMREGGVTGRFIVQVS
jgi:2-desacetyl-2-hydroxyethyl bacteriochlorophyllide A dehydrogenase